MIGTAELPTGLPAPYPPVLLLPVNLEARHVVGMGIGFGPDSRVLRYKADAPWQLLLARGVSMGVD
jgi:hypothetical protein